MYNYSRTRVEDGYTITELSDTEDFKIIRAVIKTPVGSIENDTPITIPKDPVVELRDRISAMERLQNELLLGGMGL